MTVTKSKEIMFEEKQIEADQSDQPNKPESKQIHLFSTNQI